MQRGVSSSITTSVEPMSDDLPRRGRQWCGAAQHGETSFGVYAVRVAASSQQKHCGRLMLDPLHRQHARSKGLDNRNDQEVELLELLVKETDRPCEVAKGGLSSKDQSPWQCRVGTQAITSFDQFSAERRVQPETPVGSRPRTSGFSPSLPGSRARQPRLQK